MTTESTWAKRVEAWRRSELTAAEFSDGKGFAAATLRWWSSRLRRRTTRPPQLMLARVVTRSSASAERAATIVVELGSARVLVPSGVTAEELTVVLDALERRADRGGAR